VDANGKALMRMRVEEGIDHAVGDERGHENSGDEQRKRKPPGWPGVR
jgi:hypothetical protein